MPSPSPSPPLFASNPAWADVTPIEQYEGPTPPLAPILYGGIYKDATDYLRAIVASAEKTPRVLELTEAVVRLNPSHYTAWQYRYETLLSLISTHSEGASALIQREEDLMDELAIRSLKSYQVWHHRRLVLLLSVGGGGAKLTQQEIERVKRELEFISRSFEEDSKNYHTWSYRQWVLSRFFGTEASGAEVEGKAQDDLKDEIDAKVQGEPYPTDSDPEDDPSTAIDAIWTHELAWTERMLDKDVRNNSAWHHRFFVVLARPGARAGDEVGRREVRYAKQSISLAPNNASAWNYLRGVLDRLGISYADLRVFVGLYVGQEGKEPKKSNDGEGTKEEEDEDIIDTENPRPAPGAALPCAAALEFLADIWERSGEREGVLRGVEIWKSLANEHDTMRRRYWEHRIREGIESLGTGGKEGGRGVSA